MSPEDGLTITSVEVMLRQYPAINPPYRWRNGLPGSDPEYTGAWLAITTASGVTGYAPCVRGVIVQDIVDRRIRREILGIDALRREYLWERLWEIDRVEELPLYVLGLVDMAVWDIAAKAAGLPLHKLLGSYRDSIPAYASTATFGSIAEYLDVADQCKELGYTALKLHAWGDVREDAALGAALRSHLGDDYPLMYDGSAGFDLSDAVYLGRALGNEGFLWYEEPMREFSISAYKRLAEKVEIPLLVAETSDGVHMNTADFIVSGAASAVRTSSGLKGGITGAMRIAHLADSFLMRAEVHGGGPANAHLCMAISNTTYYESFVGSNPVKREAAVGNDGQLRPPTGPGIGWSPE